MSRAITDALRTVTSGAAGGAALLALTLLLGRSAAAQEAADADLRPGMRVRIAAPDIAAAQLVGVIDKLDPHSVTLALPLRQRTIEVPRDSIVSVDVSEGPRSRWVNFGIGAAGGGITGAVACVAANDRSRSGYFALNNGLAAGVCGVLGALLGAFIGAELPPGEQWRRVAPSSVHISVVPRVDHDLGFAVSLAF